ncbi:MAG: GNAT family N-acetyltransferase [Jatrophihabitantaceae bacterium]
MPNDPKVMARSLRSQLHARGLELTHGECLDIVAQQLGHRDWNVLSARHSLPAVLRLQRECEWRAMNGTREIGRITAVRRPDARWYVACDTWFDAVHDALVSAVARDLAQDLHARADEGDSESLARYRRAGFAEHRREAEYSIDVADALAALGPTEARDFSVVSAADVDDAELRILDDALRADVPGCAGWTNDPQEFRENTFSPNHFDPAAYLVARATDGHAVGLVRIWGGRGPRRLGLIGVLAPHRRRGVARTLLREAFAAVGAQGVTAVAAEADTSNVASQELLRLLGARRTGGTVELLRPAAVTVVDAPA